MLLYIVLASGSDLVLKLLSHTGPKRGCKNVNLKGMVEDEFKLNCLKDEQKDRPVHYEGQDSQILYKSNASNPVNVIIRLLTI